MRHPIDVLYEDLKFQRSKLNNPMKVWEVELRLRIEQKISELELAIKILNKNNHGKK